MTHNDTSHCGVVKATLLPSVTPQTQTQAAKIGLCIWEINTLQPYALLLHLHECPLPVFAGIKMNYLVRFSFTHYSGMYFDLILGLKK